MESGFFFESGTRISGGAVVAEVQEEARRSTLSRWCAGAAQRRQGQGDDSDLMATFE